MNWHARVIALGVLLACALAARANTISLGTQQDNTLYGSATGGLSNGAGMYMFVGKTAQSGGSPTNLRRALVQFDVAGNIPAGSTINSVSLTLYLSQIIQAGPVELHKLSASWGEGTSNATCNGGNEGCGATSVNGDATWIHRVKPNLLWNTPGGDFSPTISASILVGTQPTNSYTWGSTAQMVSDVQSWLNTPSTNAGWLLRGEETADGATAKRFNTRENPTASTRPMLVIDFTPAPEPGSLLLLAMGASAVMRRRPLAQPHSWV